MQTPRVAIFSALLLTGACAVVVDGAPPAIGWRLLEVDPAASLAVLPAADGPELSAVLVTPSGLAGLAVHLGLHGCRTVESLGEDVLADGELTLTWAQAPEADTKASLVRPPLSQPTDYVPADAPVRVHAKVRIADATEHEIAVVPVETTVHVATQGECDVYKLRFGLCAEAPELLALPFARALAANPTMVHTIDSATLAFDDPEYLARRIEYLRGRAKELERRARQEQKAAEVARDAVDKSDGELAYQDALAGLNSSLASGGSSPMVGFQRGMNDLSIRLRRNSLQEKAREQLRRGEQAEDEAARLAELAADARHQAAAATERLASARRK